MSKLTCIVLDDYQGAAKASDSWRRLADSVDVAFMSHHVEHDDELVHALRGADVVVVMRENWRLCGPMPCWLTRRAQVWWIATRCWMH